NRTFCAVHASRTGIDARVCGRSTSSACGQAGCQPRHQAPSRWGASLASRRTERLCVIVMHDLDLAFRFLERRGMLWSHSTLSNLPGGDCNEQDATDDAIWTVVVTLIAVTINPILKSVGLLPADVFKNLGIAFPGQPQIVFGPLMAFLLLALFLKTGKAMVFPVIGL